MKIYLASSFRNGAVTTVARVLRREGHHVHDPSAPENWAAFEFAEIDSNWRRWPPEKVRTRLLHPRADQALKRETTRLLEWCDAALLVLPAGSSAHAVWGTAVGAGKRGLILYPTDVVWPGHSMSGRAPCSVCEPRGRAKNSNTIPGCCHVPARLLSIEPELAYGLAKKILVGLGDAVNYLRASELEQRDLPCPTCGAPLSDARHDGAGPCGAKGGG